MNSNVQQKARYTAGAWRCVLQRVLPRAARWTSAATLTFSLVACRSQADSAGAGGATKSSSGGAAASATAAASALRIWWAQWAPADSLQTLAKEYTAETGVQVQIHQIPWPKFQDQVFQEFGKRETNFDIVVGDSQWLGRGATRELYLDLTEWLPQAVSLSALHPLALQYLAEYPPASGHYWAAPCETDAVGFAYRKDWFADPNEQKAFAAKYGHPLAPPTTWDELQQIAQFFHRPTDKKYGVAVLTGRDYDELVMGFEQVLYAFGGAWGDFKTRAVSGHVDSPKAVEALDFYRKLVALSPPGGSKLGFGEVLEPLQNGTVAMAMNYFAFFPSLSSTMGDKIGYFAMPEHAGRRVASLGGQGLSISKKVSASQQEAAKRFIAWFLAEPQQRKWVKLPGGFTANAAILKSEEFRAATPYNAAFAQSMDMLQDFWNVPTYNELLASVVRHVGAALDGTQPPQQALTALAAEQGQILAAP
jgi:multiple sugar transport system substrate-binding protein